LEVSKDNMRAISLYEKFGFEEIGVTPKGMYHDDAYLLSSRAFAGSDTLATAYTLAQAVRKIGNVDLILTGLKAIDADTGQVGPLIAEELDLPQITNASG